MVGTLTEPRTQRPVANWLRDHELARALNLLWWWPAQFRQTSLRGYGLERGDATGVNISAVDYDRHPTYGPMVSLDGSTQYWTTTVTDTMIPNLSNWAFGGWCRADVVNQAVSNAWLLDSFIGDTAGLVSIGFGNRASAGDGVYFYNYDGSEDVIGPFSVGAGEVRHYWWENRDGTLYGLVDGAVVGSVASGATNTTFTMELGRCISTATASLNGMFIEGMVCSPCPSRALIRELVGQQKWALYGAIDELAYKAPAAGATGIDFEGFRFREDDGNETAATWKAAQDTNVVCTPTDHFRLRFLLDAPGTNPVAYRVGVEYRLWNAASWTKVPVEGDVHTEAIEVALSDFIGGSGESTSAQLTAPATKTTDDFDVGIIRDNQNPTMLSIDIGNDGYTAVEFNFQATSDARKGVPYQIRPYLQIADGSPLTLDNYHVTAQVVFPLEGTMGAPTGEILASPSISLEGQMGLVRGVVTSPLMPSGGGGLFMRRRRR